MDMAPEGQVLGLANEYFASRALHIIVELGVADQISETPVPSDMIAAAIGAQAPMLERLLAILETRHIFHRTPAGWTHSLASRYLRRDHPQSMAPFVRMIGSEPMWRSAGMLTETVRTGTCAAEILYKGGLWGHFQRHPDESHAFDAAMNAKAHGEIAAIVPVIDIGQAITIADIGGGRGHMLRAILERFHSLSGLLVDQPHVVDGSVPHPRITPIGLDFFRDSLPPADLYVLGNIIHDWDDAKALAILASIRRAAPGGARVMLFEQVLPDYPVPHPAFTLDLCMMATTGGKERTAAAYGNLLAQAGFRLVGVTPTASPTSIVVAELA